MFLGFIFRDHNSFSNNLMKFASKLHCFAFIYASISNVFDSDFNHFPPFAHI